MIIIFRELWLMFLLDYFLYLWSFVFACFFYFKWFKGKYTNNNKIYTYNYKNKYSIIKNKKSYYYWNDTIYIDDFDTKYLKINRRESQAGIDIYYIGYVLYKLEFIMKA